MERGIRRNVLQGVAGLITDLECQELVEWGFSFEVPNAKTLTIRVYLTWSPDHDSTIAIARTDDVSPLNLVSSAVMLAESPAIRNELEWVLGTVPLIIPDEVYETGASM